MSSPGPPRDSAIDRLRVLGVLAVIVAHVGQVFNPWDQWHVTDARRSRLVGEVVVYCAPWVLPLLMLVAGAASWHTLQRRGARDYLRTRVRDLLLPLAGAWLLLVPPQAWLESTWRGEFAGAFVAFLPWWLHRMAAERELPLYHLWFLVHLLAYSVVALPLALHWRTERGRARLDALARRCRGPLGLLWLAAPLVLERHLLWWLLPGSESLASDWTNYALLFGAYVYGIMLAGSPALARDVDRQWPNALLLAAAFSSAVGALAWRGVLPHHLPPPYEPGYLTFWALYGVGTWAWLVALVGLARRMPRAAPALLDFARRRSQAWYLAHQPVVLAAAVWLVPQALPLAATIAGVAVLSAVGTLAAAELAARTPGLRRVLGVGARR